MTDTATAGTAWLADLAASIPATWTDNGPAVTGRSTETLTTRTFTSPDRLVTLTAYQRCFGDVYAELTGPGWTVLTDGHPAAALAEAARVAATAPDTAEPRTTAGHLGRVLEAAGWTAADINDTRLLERSWTSPDRARKVAWCPSDEDEPDCFFATCPGLNGRPVQAVCDHSVPAGILLALAQAIAPA